MAKDTLIFPEAPRSNRGGGGHRSVEVTVEPLKFNFDESRLAKGPAGTIRELLKEKIQGIHRNAKPETIARRNRAAREYAGGSSSRWIRERYAGKPPKSAHNDALFNDSGQLADGLEVRKERDGFSVVAPKNRLSSENFLRRLASLVEELRNPRRLVANRKVQKSIEKSVDLLVTKARR